MCLFIYTRRGNFGDLFVAEGGEDDVAEIAGAAPLRF